MMLDSFTVNVDDKDFIIVKMLDEKTESELKFRFVTSINEEPYWLAIRLTSAAIKDEETHGLNAEAELLEILKEEIRAEIQKVLSK